MGKKYPCEYCDTVLARLSNLRRHIRSRHSMHYESFKSKQNENSPFQRVRSLKCSICDLQATRQELDLHYMEFHEIDLNIERIRFTSLNTFHEWKAAIEKENHCKYVNSCGRKPNHERYMCHRSGEFRSKSKGLRSLKRIGSKKIGSHCPSKMIVTKRGNICDVKFVKTHIGHENELCHVPLRPEERAKIANMLSQKIPPAVALEEIKNELRATNKRIDLLTLKDLYNISKAFKIDIKSDTDPQNEIDVSKLVSDLTSSDFENPIVYHKPMGETDDFCPELQSDDFVLIIMNQTQVELLQYYFENTVILDRTWKISYSLHLLTLFVLDENHQAFPCCFLFTNNDDESRLKLLFEILKLKLGALQTNVFMCGTAEQYYKAWTSVMGAPKFHVYCPWSVNQTWVANLPKIKNPDKQNEVNEILKNLSEEPTTEKFPVLLNQAVQKITGNEETRQFGQYFCKFYLQNVMKWARCYQIKLGLNDISDLEKACKIIKCIYFNIKKRGDLNDCILFLYRFLRDKLFSKRTTYCEEEVARQQHCSEQNHITSTLTSYSNAVTASGGWVIISSADKTVNEVRKQEFECQCKIFCNECEVCVHHYTCSCTDNSILWNMCRHIHYLCKSLQQSVNEENIIVINDESITIRRRNKKTTSSNDANSKVLEEFYLSEDEDADMNFDETLADQSQIKAVSEINGIMDEIILNMQDEEASSFVISNLKNILDVLKTKQNNPLTTTTIVID